MSKARAAKIANSPDASSTAARSRAQAATAKQGGTTAQHKGRPQGRHGRGKKRQEVVSP